VHRARRRKGPRPRQDHGPVATRGRSLEDAPRHLEQQPPTPGLTTRIPENDDGQQPLKGRRRPASRRCGPIRSGEVEEIPTLTFSARGAVLNIAHPSGRYAAGLGSPAPEPSRMTNRHQTLCFVRRRCELESRRAIPLRPRVVERVDSHDGFDIVRSRFVYRDAPSVARAHGHARYADDRVVGSRPISARRSCLRQAPHHRLVRQNSLAGSAQHAENCFDHNILRACVRLIVIAIHQ
jgi:hypothetical protein